MSATGNALPVGLLGNAIQTSAGRSRAIAARKASESSVKSPRSGTPAKRTRNNSACIENMTNEGVGAITTAPSRAIAAVMYWMHSSEPLPSSTSQPAGTCITSRIRARRRSAVGTG